MVSFTYDKDTRIVEVDLPDTELNIQDLYDNIKDWEDELENQDVYHLINGAGKQELGGGVSVGITLTLLGWRVKFADRSGPDWVVCDVAGGNLVCVTGTDDEIKNMSGISYINPIAPATFVTVTKTSSSSATLSTVQLEGLEYNGVVSIDIDHGTSGVAYPIGTIYSPVNNAENARTIADQYNIRTYNIKGVLSLQTGYEDWKFIGGSSVLSDIIVLENQPISYSSFEELTISNYLNGTGSEFVRCILANINNMDSIAYESAISGTLIVGSGSSFIGKGISCMSNPVYIDMSNTGSNLIANLEGNVEVSGMKKGSSISIGLSYGNCVINESCIGGTGTIGGIGRFVDNSSGVYLIEDYLLSVSAIEEKLRVGNISYEFITATGDIPARNVVSGALDYMIIRYKNDSDNDWSNPRRTDYQYMSYPSGLAQPSGVGAE